MILIKEMNMKSITITIILLALSITACSKKDEEASVTSEDGMMPSAEQMMTDVAKEHMEKVGAGIEGVVEESTEAVVEMTAGIKEKASEARAKGEECTETSVEKVKEVVAEKAVAVEEVQEVAEDKEVVSSAAAVVAAATSAVVSDEKTTSLSKDDALSLAQSSGCLACHKIESKLIGPAWENVAAKYKGDSGAKSRLIEKVKKGGKGNWTEVTGGMPMPAYSPRVSDENIEKLVTFILSL